MKKVKRLGWRYTARADMCVDIRDIPEIIEKINELVEAVNEIIPYGPGLEKEEDIELKKKL